jgi:hypothetical protein
MLIVPNFLYIRNCNDEEVSLPPYSTYGTRCHHTSLDEVVHGYTGTGKQIRYGSQLPFSGLCNLWIGKYSNLPPTARYVTNRTAPVLYSATRAVPHRSDPICTSNRTWYRTVPLSAYLNSNTGTYCKAKFTK